MHSLSWQFLNLLSHNNPNLAEVKKKKKQNPTLSQTYRNRSKCIIAKCGKKFSIFFCDLVDLTLGGLYCKKYNIARIQEINNEKLITFDNLFVLNLELT